MKTLLTLCTVVISFFYIPSFSQTVNKWNHDGWLYFKVIDTENIEIPSYGKYVDLKNVKFLNPFIEEYGLVEIIKPFYTADDIKLQNTYKVHFTEIQKINDLIRDLSLLSFIEYAEPAPIYYISYTPNDTYFVNNNVNYWLLGDANTRWHLDVINAEAAWDISKGDTNIIVAVLDNAIWTDHPDLQNKIAIQIDLADDDSTASPPAAEYIWSHGTHTSGLIAAESDNSIGVASLGYNVRLMAVKLASDASDGQAMTAGFEGIVWAADHGADVINMSWGSPQFFITMQNTVNYAYNKGCVLLGAAGNNGDGAETSVNPAIPVNYIGYPAALEHVIAVGSTDSDDAKSSFSEYGTWIDVCAPGGFDTQTGIFSVLSTTYSDAGDILSLFSGTGGGAAAWGISGKYDCMQGTSMACPVASGLAGLMLSVNPNLTPEELTAIMKATCDNIDAQNTQFIDSIGAGRINAAAALQSVLDSMALSPVTADFMASNVVIPLGHAIDFTDLSIGSITSWSWTFDGGNPGTSTDQNPTGIQYDTTGIFSVTLYVSDGTNNDTEIKTYFIIVGQGSSGNSAWLPQATGFSAQFRGILDISIVDPNTVWAITYDGTSGTMTKDFTRTINGGNNWLSGNIDVATNYDVANISAINEDTAWVAMYDANGGGAILKTTDAGQTWVHQTSALFNNASSFANVVHFFNENDGFCMGDPINNEFEIYITVDGGDTWTAVDGTNIPNPQSGEMGWTNTYYAVNDTAWFGSNTGRIFKSIDKGATWNVYTSGEANVSGISMHDGLNGIMLAAVYDQTTGALTSWNMRKTNDGGETWQSVTPVGNYFKSDMSAVPGVPGKIISTGISQNLSECGSSYSLDYGTSWTLLDDSIQYTMVEFFDDTSGWAGGFNLDSLIEGIWKWLGVPITGNPVITSIPLTSVVVNDTYIYNITASDPNSLPLTIVADTLPVWLTFNQLTDTTAIITGVPDSTDVGNHFVQISASNGIQSVSQPYSIEVLTDIPFFTSSPTTSFIYVGDTVNYLATADDYNGTPLTFGYNLLPSFASITDNGNNTADVYGIADSAGYKYFDIWVTDGIHTVHQTWVRLVKPISGINEYSVDDLINIFPNPAKDFISFVVKGECDINNISVYNILGELIHTETDINKSYYFLDISNVYSGVYVVELMIGNRKVNAKIIVE
ncbi:MAG: S8 family serine peptidase [Bacteroidota bacterium]